MQCLETDVLRAGPVAASVTTRSCPSPCMSNSTETCIWAQRRANTRAPVCSLGLQHLICFIRDSAFIAATRCRYPGMQQDCSRAATELQAILAQAFSSSGFGSDAAEFSLPSRSANPVCRDESFTSCTSSHHANEDIDYGPPSPCKTKRSMTLPMHLTVSPPLSFAGRLSPSCSLLHMAHTVN